MADHLARIRARRDEIARAIELLRAEDEDLATTELVLERFEGQSAKGPSSAAPAARYSSRPRSQREFVLDVLASSDAVWLRASEIVKQARARWGADIPEASLRPLLSVMKRQRQIVRQGRYVALRERGLETPHTARRKEA